MLRLILILIFIVIAVILILAALKPKTFRVMRSAIIPTTPDKVFTQINDLHHWEAWSAWSKKDLNMAKTYSGPSFGKGAIYEWNGNKNVGSGRMEIIESIAPTLVVIKLDFITPFEGHNKSSFALQVAPEGTKVVWVMDGPMAFIPKIFSLFVDMDKMIGKDFEEGLEGLKSVSCK
jgi:hypothetical protein